METITITKTEYKKLLSRAKAYEKLAGSIFENAIKDPVNEIVSDFKKTNLYTVDFLKDLEDGLKKSSLAKNKK
jgi:hypothetical protein